MPDKKSCRSEADRRNTVVRGNSRFTVLTPRLIRLEYDQEGIFEDRPTKTVLNRDFPAVDFTLSEQGEGVIIETSDLTLYYHGGEFSSHSLEISLKADCHVHGSRWYFSQKPETLKGTCRTLDEADGAVPLEEGLVSRDGFSYLDDSQTMVFEEGQLVPAGRPHAVDGYFFGYARDYFGALKDFFFLSSGTPRLPRYALGNWWSRYWAYSQDEFLALTDSFAAEKIPFSVFVVDMDWHLVDVEERFGGGWTGYSWNRELIPDPEGLLKELHNRNYRVTLNLHPASGVRAYEDAYPEMARALGVDPESESTLPLRLEDREFLNAYFRYLHHPLEDQGVDFWWVDWQQGSVSSRPGMDPLWLLNHYHCEDMEKRGKTPLILSRYAGPGSHRYPVGFSGDTVISWESLAFQPYFTST
ncbi:MAG: glycoside hydrolase family 31 protein, partial [Spirochaetales bacterium]|nr:glycoside hydrolase family 31 protein [Spirochaetales bacterium]